MMITLKTITTIELSNDCQLRCHYCINKNMEEVAQRKRQIMSKDVFILTLSWLKKLCDAGTQQEVNMNGNGESFLDPNLFIRIRKVKNVIGPERKVNISTNGILMNDLIAQQLKICGLDDIQVSVHKALAARTASQILMTNGVRGSFNFGAIQFPHNWAGQIEPKYCARVLPNIPCHPLEEGRGYVSVEGYLSPCCYDYRLIGSFGSVFDNDLLEREIKPFDLCATCHQIIPDEIKAAYGITQMQRKVIN